MQYITKDQKKQSEIDSGEYYTYEHYYDWCIDWKTIKGT